MKANPIRSFAPALPVAANTPDGTKYGIAIPPAAIAALRLRKRRRESILEPIICISLKPTVKFEMQHEKNRCQKTFSAMVVASRLFP